MVIILLFGDIIYSIIYNLGPNNQKIVDREFH
jgi:hypothetical protein